MKGSKMDKEEYHALRRRVTEDLRQVFHNALGALDEKLKEIDRERKEDKDKDKKTAGVR